MDDGQEAYKFLSQAMFPICVGGSKQSDGPTETNSFRSGLSLDSIRAFFEAPISEKTCNSQRRRVWLFQSQKQTFCEQLKPSATEVKFKTKNWPRSYDDAQSISKFKGELDGTQDREQRQIS